MAVCSETGDDDRSVHVEPTQPIRGTQEWTESFVYDQTSSDYQQYKLQWTLLALTLMRQFKEHQSIDHGIVGLVQIRYDSTNNSEDCTEWHEPKPNGNHKFISTVGIIRPGGGLTAEPDVPPKHTWRWHWLGGVVWNANDINMLFIGCSWVSGQRNVA